jgi:hypothetical protein
MRLPLLLLLPALLASTASAQEPADPASTAPMRIGPVAMTPALSITNVGVETNVFNEWVDPKSDWTATVSPQTELWLRLGRARLTATAKGSFVYFAHYSAERSLNTSDSAKLEVPFLRVRPYVGVTYLNIRDRPGFEIDKRARRTERGLVAGVEFPLSAKTTVGVGYKKTTIAFPSDVTFLGTYLRDLFNRSGQGVTATFRYRLTPLTTLILDAETERQRFEFTPVRDSNSVRVVPGVEFNRFALINGNAHVGFRRLKMLTPGMPDYTGLVASINLGYTLLGATRFSVGVQRDVEYSFEVTEPYYLLTGLSGSVTQAVGGPWDVVGRLGTQRLAYQRTLTDGAGTAPQAIPSATGRVDTIRFYGGGIGYKVGPTVRLGFNADYFTRTSDRVTREYRGLRAGTSVTYGF